MPHHMGQSCTAYVKTYAVQVSSVVSPNSNTHSSIPTVSQHLSVSLNVEAVCVLDKIAEPLQFLGRQHIQFVHFLVGNIADPRRRRHFLQHRRRRLWPQIPKSSTRKSIYLRARQFVGTTILRYSTFDWPIATFIHLKSFLSQNELTNNAGCELFLFLICMYLCKFCFGMFF